MNAIFKSHSKYLSLFFALFLFSGLSFGQEQTEFVSIDGFKYHVKLGGMEHLKDSIPIVVLELGYGSTLKSWDPIYNDLIQFAPVFAYERAGIGQSEWNDIEPTPINVANNLKNLLTLQELKPPYILAAHSWGSAIIRAYAGHFKEDVKALVYIDPMDYTMTTENDEALFKSIGADPDAALKFMEDLDEFFAGQENSPGMSAENDVFKKFINTPLENRNLGEEPNLPLVVFIGTKIGPAPRLPAHIKQAFDHNDYMVAETKLRIESLSKWPYDYSDEGYLFISPNATHFFHYGEPEMVIKMIKKFTE